MKRLKKCFEVTAEGNFEVSKHVEELEAAAGLKAVQHANILHHMNAPQIPNDDEYKNLIAELFSRRAKRIRPGLDDKILASWNGWMIGAFAKAGRVLENKKFILAAEKAMNFVLTKMLQKDTLLRCYRNGSAKQEAFLEDYSAIVFALIELSQSTLDAKYLSQAIDWQKKQDAYFLDRKAGGYFDDRGQDIRIPIRSKEFMDDATPGGNAMSAWNAARLFKFTGDAQWRDLAKSLVEQATDLMHKYPSAFPLMNLALAEMHGKSLLIAGDFKVEEMANTLGFVTWSKVDPNLLGIAPIFTGKSVGTGKTQYYLCEGDACQLPSDDLKAVLAEILR